MTWVYWSISACSSNQTPRDAEIPAQARTSTQTR